MLVDLQKSKIKHPNKNEAEANVRKIFKFEKPKTFKVRRSRLFLIFIINHILERKIMKGKKNFYYHTWNKNTCKHKWYEYTYINILKLYFLKQIQYNSETIKDKDKHKKCF